VLEIIDVGEASELPAGTPFSAATIPAGTRPMISMIGGTEASRR
jgi:hypothetical protein